MDPSFAAVWTTVEVVVFVDDRLSRLDYDVDAAKASVVLLHWPHDGPHFHWPDDPYAVLGGDDLSIPR